jgi:hypothetical protein
VEEARQPVAAVLDKGKSDSEILLPSLSSYYGINMIADNKKVRSPDITPTPLKA